MDELSESDLRQFTGGDVRYRHAFNRAAIYTEGVQFLAEREQAIAGAKPQEEGCG